MEVASINQFPLPLGFSGLVDTSQHLPRALLVGIPNYPPRTASEVSVYVAVLTVAWICLSAVVKVCVRACLQSHRSVQTQSDQTQKPDGCSGEEECTTKTTARRRAKAKSMGLELILPTSEGTGVQKPQSNNTPQNELHSSSGTTSPSSSDDSFGSSSSPNTPSSPNAAPPTSPSVLLLDACARAAGLSRSTGLPRTLLDVSASSPSLHVLAGSILSPTSPFSSTTTRASQRGKEDQVGGGGRDFPLTPSKISPSSSPKVKGSHEEVGVIYKQVVSGGVGSPYPLAAALDANKEKEDKEIMVGFCEEELSSRIVSLIHGTLSTAYATYILFFVRFPQFSGVDTRSVPSSSELSFPSTFASFAQSTVCLNEPPLVDEQLLTSFVASYFIHDTLGILFGSFFDITFLLHHVGALVILLSSLLGMRMGQEMCVGVLLLESTSPQLHLRWLMTALGWGKDEQTNEAGNEGKDGKVSKSRFSALLWLSLKVKKTLWWLCDTGFLISFGGIRLGMGLVAFALFSPSLCPTAPIASFAVLGIIFLFSALFFLKTVAKVRRGEPWVA